MSANDKKQGVVSGIVVNSISAAIVYDAQKEKNSLIVIAYSKGDAVEDIKFTAIKLPKKALYGRNDFINAIKDAEKVRNVTYVDYDGFDKDIFICRPKDGDVYDFVDRNDMQNRFTDGFSEIESSGLKFSVNELSPIKIDKPFETVISYSPTGSEYPQNSLPWKHRYDTYPKYW